MISDNKKSKILELFRDGFNPYRISKVLNTPLNTVTYNMNKWIKQGVLERITPGTPILCKLKKDPDNKSLSLNFDYTNKDIIHRLHTIENSFIEYMFEIKKAMKEIKREMNNGGNGGLIQNQIIIDKKSLSVSNEDVREMMRHLKRTTTGNFKK